MNNYQVLLESSEWKSKRESILNRDKLTCKNCKNDFLEDDFQKGYALRKSLRSHFLIFKDNVSGEMLGRYISQSYSQIIPDEFMIFYSKNTDDGDVYIGGIRALTLHEIKLYNNIELKNYYRKKQNKGKLQFSIINSNQSTYNWIIVEGLHVHHLYVSIR